ncbi:MAG: TonB-dependent receptor [Niabella sp.]|nr:TonB-dependent receptor [Niabella sp.]
MRRLRIYVLLMAVLAFSAPCSLWAQNGRVSGTVVSEANNPMPGVTVTVKGTSIVAVTDEAGAFSIQAEKDQTLQFSYVGYQPLELRISGEGPVTATLQPGSNSLDEIIVVGYGKQRRGNITGAVTNVNMDNLKSRPIADVGRGLQGVVPGLSIRIPSGEVGSDPLINIRGFIGSIQGSSQPLILVDNVEVPSIQDLNPNDVESVTVLKDAASASIYGAKAAFGVILITMKKGTKTQGNTLTYSTNLSWQTPFKDLELAGIDGLQYTLDAQKNMKGSGPAGGFWRLDSASLEKAREWQRLYGNTVKSTDPVVYGRDWYFNGTDKYGYRIYDPIDAMIKKYSFTQNHNISLNGRTNNTTYNVGFGYLGQEGMMKPAEHDDFTRYTANLKVSTKVNDYVTVRAGMMYSDRTKRYPNSTNTASGFGADPWLYLYRWSLLFPTGVKELGEEIRDPYWDAKNAPTAYQKNKYLNVNFGTTIDVTKNWQIIADYTYDSRNNRQNSALFATSLREPWYAAVPWLDDDGDRVYVDDAGNVTDSAGIPGYRFPLVNYVTNEQSYVKQITMMAQRHTVNAYSVYNLKLGTLHDFRFTLGTNIVTNKWTTDTVQKMQLIKNDPQFKFAVGNQKGNGDADWDSQLGYFGRINYAFNNRYLIEGNLRYDATSKFPAFMRWKWYPSFSAGWVLSDEAFMKGLKPVLSFAKLRGSWGSIGDQSVDNGLYMSLMDISQNSWLTSVGQQVFQIGTPGPVSAGIGWQDIQTLDFGADLRFFKNKFGIVFDWYSRETKNMIIGGQALPATFGAGAPQGNYGNLRTTGWEIAFDFNHRFQSGLGLNLSANLSDATTVITKAADWNTPWENRSVDNTFVTGKRYGDIYGYVTDRLYQKEDFVYDANGNFVQETIVWQGSAKRTNKLAGDNPVYQTFFEDGNQILLVSPGDVKFVDVNGDGYITPGKSTFGDPGDRVVIGNVLPRYEYGFRIALDYKSFDFSVMGQGVGKRSIWGSGQLAIPGYFAKEGAMPQAIAGNYWRADRTDAFYPRAWDMGGSNSGFVMVPQTRYLLNMAYFRVKNITLGYTVAENILRRVRMKQARLYVSMENFITFDKLRGLPIDPEAISGVSMLRGDGNYNLGRTGTSNPTFKIASVGINVGF